MKQLVYKKIMRIEKNNGREDLIKIRIEDMLSSRDLSCATHQPLLES
jgi:hypothetical protein